MLLEKAKELKNQRKIAKYFGCTAANISWHIKEYNIREEMNKALGKISKEEIVRLYNLLGTKVAVAKHVGLTKARICQVIKEASSINAQEQSK